MDHPTVRNSLSLLVVIPCLNEEKTVGRVIAQVPGQIDGFGAIKIIVMDDGSTDRTAEVAREAGAEVIIHAANMGLGSTFREAVGIAGRRGIDVLLHIDGDGQFDAGDIETLVKPIVERRADMVTASRFMKRELMPQMPFIKKWGNKRVAGIVRLITGQRFHDVSCGFRAYSKEALLRMNLFGSFTYTQEVFLDLVFKGMNIIEVPVKVRGTREFGASRIASSIPRYALRSLQIMLRTFISYRPLKLFSVLAGTFLLIGLGFISFLGWHYFKVRAFSPHIWAGFVGGSFSFLGIMTLIIGLVGDMLVRIRMNQESILYFLRKSRWEAADREHKGLRSVDSQGSEVLPG
ncbi:MAG: glycosyltransferase family 2 protein [Woeseia sp.]|nr:glycosyltransferase family 2 protein [Woeseia sp.]MBT8097756.1 glycosyltransferase family 2 protein [Woeseia sp.]NNE60507.1 glycosyltransferase family 2 protein [Woeseia sp.]NNL54969.1 glycosyltransferase family 2 protein [Woeseia sp.]